MLAGKCSMQSVVVLTSLSAAGVSALRRTASAGNFGHSAPALDSSIGEDVALGGHEHTQVRLGKMGKAEGAEGHSTDITDVSKAVLTHSLLVALVLEFLTCLHPWK